MVRGIHLSPQISKPKESQQNTPEDPSTIVPEKKYMGVSKNNGTPKSSHFNRVFPYKPSILGYPYFWNHPYPLQHVSPGCFARPSSRIGSLMGSRHAIGSAVVCLLRLKRLQFWSVFCTEKKGWVTKKGRRQTKCFFFGAASKSPQN